MSVYELNLSQIRAYEGYPNAWICACGSRKDVGIKRLVKKIPMDKTVIDESGDMYRYLFIDSNIVFVRIGNCKI